MIFYRVGLGSIFETPKPESTRHHQPDNPTTRPDNTPNRCYARQAVEDNAVNRRSCELLKVIKNLSGEADVMRARELAREEECERLKAKCEAAITDFDKNPTVLLLREKISSLAVEEKEHKGNLD
ncbi:hypothetical protein Tco_0071388, partial [Tanacetum coccineum]